jgi:hypothetical protein
MSVDALLWIREEIERFMPPREEFYRHCVACDWIFKDKDYKVKITFVGNHKKEIFGVVPNITSGYCLPCFEKHHPKCYAKMIQERQGGIEE